MSEEQVIKYVRISSSFDIIVDNHSMHLYYCVKCGVMVVDRFAHNTEQHHSSKLEVENEMRSKGSFRKGKAELKEIGKKIKIIGAGKK